MKSDDRVGPPQPHILEEEVGAEVVLFDSERQLFVSLNETASDIWRLADGRFSLDELVAKLAASYGTDSDSIRSDVESTVQELIDADLLPAVGE